MGWLARCRQAGGDLIEAIETRSRDDRTVWRTGAQVSHSLGSLALYWAGRGRRGRRVGRQRDRDGGRRRTMRRSRCTRCRTRHLTWPQSGAMRMRRGSSARRARSAASTARCLCSRARIDVGGISTSSLGDYDAAERIQLEARDLARSANFRAEHRQPEHRSAVDCRPPRRSRQRRVAIRRDRRAHPERIPAGTAGSGNFGVSQVRAELSYTRGDWEGAIAAATLGIEQCRRCSRPKSETLGSVTRAQALAASQPIDRGDCRRTASGRSGARHRGSRAAAAGERHAARAGRRRRAGRLRRRTRSPGSSKAFRME